MTPEEFRQIAQQNIFPGESGGDYGALFGYAGREGGQFAGVDPQRMTLNQLLEFQDPNGPYGQWVKQQNNGTVSTPAGAYQIVGRTLRGAMGDMGLTGNEMFDQQMQDAIGAHIYQTQGPGAWEGWRGDRGGSQVSTMGNRNPPQAVAADAAGLLGNGGGQMAAQEQPQGLLGMLGIQKRDESAGGQTALPFYQRDQFSDVLGGLASGFNSMRLNPDESIPQQIQARQAGRQQKQQANRTIEWLRSQPGGERFAEMAQAAGPQAALQAYQASMQGPEVGYTQVRGSDLGLTGESAGALFNVGPDGKISGIGGTAPVTNVNVGGPQQTAGWEAIDKGYADTWLRDSVSGLPDVANQAAQISNVLGQLESGAELTGPTVGVQGDFVRAILNPEAQDAKDRVEQVVQRSLRETLGAQFTAAEGDRLIARSYNVNLPPEQNAARLRALFTQLQAVAAQKLAMRDYFNQNGTLQGFSGSMSIPTIDDFLATMDAAAPTATAGGSGGTTDTGLTWSIVE